MIFDSHRSISKDLINACKDLQSVVDQINLDFTALDQPHFAAQKAFCSKPANMASILRETCASLNGSLADRLFYEKLQTMQVPDEDNVLHLYNKDFWAEINLNRPLLYVKLDSLESLQVIARSGQQSLNGLILKAATLQEASELIKAAKRLPGLKNLDYQAEVAVTSMDQARSLRQEGFSRVQVPGTLLQEKVDHHLARAHTG